MLNKMLNKLKRKNRELNIDNSKRKELLRLLKEASKKDFMNKQFGAESHKYKLKKPIKAQKVRDAEIEFGFKLPEDYFWFITNVGNGGAGPYYGLEEFKVDNPEYLKSLSKETILSPMNSKEEYDDFMKKYNQCDDDEEFDRLCEEIEQGLLHIGTQGCTYMMKVVMTGKDRGRVLYTDDDWQRPYFAYPKSFLEWYESWLIETAAGYNMDWYGSKMTGTEEELIETFKASVDNVDLRLEVLYSLTKFKKISDYSSEILHQSYLNSPNEKEKEELIKLLIRFKNHNIDKLIIEGLRSTQPDKYVYLIARNEQMNFDKWYDEILRNMDSFSERCIEDIYWRIFIHCRNLKVEDILELFKSSNPNVRASAVGNIFRFCDKNTYFEKVFPMLWDEKKVAIRAVYMTHESEDTRLIPVYKKLLNEFEIEKNEETKMAEFYINKFLEEFSS